MRFAIAGNGKMAIDVLKVLAATPGAQPVLCLGNPAYETAQSGMAKVCREAGIRYVTAPSVNDPHALAACGAAGLDYIISANNFSIFKEPTLALAGCGVINFHNGPLPRYGGLNPCSWAILKGERQHGVTWHRVESGIDTGNVLAQSHFDIGRDETAISLISRSIATGVDLFAPLALEMVRGLPAGTMQNPGHRLYFGRRDVPWGGALAWWEPRAVLERLSRAIAFHPLANSFFKPRIAVTLQHPVWIEGFSVAGFENSGEPGTILSVNDDAIEVTALGCRLVLRDPCDQGGAPLSAEVLTAAYGITTGQKLVRPRGSPGL